jgi:hypothetical protein
MFKSKKAAPKGQPALKIAIVGTASTSVGEAPWGDESWQIWSLGRNSANCPRYDRWFELHTKDVLIAANALNHRFEFLQAAGDKLMVGHQWDELPDAKMYPWQAVIGEFGRYLTSSLSLMVALALKEGATEIGLWGVDMVCPDEYQQQRASCEYLLGIAKERGVKITIAKESPILRPTRVYGLEDAGFSREIIERKAEANIQLRDIQNRMKQDEVDYHFVRGVVSVLSDLETRWG